MSRRTNKTSMTPQVGDRGSLRNFKNYGGLRVEATSMQPGGMEVLLFDTGDPNRSMPKWYRASSFIVDYRAGK